MFLLINLPLHFHQIVLNLWPFPFPFTEIVEVKSYSSGIAPRPIQLTGFPSSIIRTTMCNRNRKRAQDIEKLFTSGHPIYSLFYGQKLKFHFIWGRKKENIFFIKMENWIGYFQYKMKLSSWLNCPGLVCSSLVWSALIERLGRWVGRTDRFCFGHKKQRGH